MVFYSFGHRNQTKAAPLGQPVRFQIAAVYAPNMLHTRRARNICQRGVGKIHRPIGITRHPIDHLLEFVLSHGVYAQAAALCPCLQLLNRRTRIHQVRKFRQYRPSGDQLAAITLQIPRASCMPTIVAACQRDQRAGVNEYAWRGFFRGPAFWRVRPCCGRLRYSR